MTTTFQPMPTGTSGATGLLRDRRVVLAFAICAAAYLVEWSDSIMKHPRTRVLDARGAGEPGG